MGNYQKMTQTCEVISDKFQVPKISTGGNRVQVKSLTNRNFHQRNMTALKVKIPCQTASPVWCGQFQRPSAGIFPLAYVCRIALGAYCIMRPKHKLGNRSDSPEAFKILTATLLSVTSKTQNIRNQKREPPPPFPRTSGRRGHT
jgi:hypothetical protein